MIIGIGASQAEAHPRSEPSLTPYYGVLSHGREGEVVVNATHHNVSGSVQVYGHRFGKKVVTCQEGRTA